MVGQTFRMIQSLPTQLMTEKSFLHNMGDSGAEKKTPDYCFTILNKAIVEIQIQNEKAVFTILTDNEAKIVKMRELALKEYPTVLRYRCSTHYMSLLEKDIGNTVILKQIVEIQKYFRNIHLDC